MNGSIGTIISCQRNGYNQGNNTRFVIVSVIFYWT